MTRSRISMVVAAGALVLVGLLAAALFSPSKDDPVDETTQTAARDEVARVQVPPAIQTSLTPAPAPMTTPPAPVVTNTQPVTPPPAPPVQAPAPDPVAKPTVIDYTIKPGDMISKLASRYGVKREDIYRLNPGLNDQTAAKIRVGEVIKVPTAPGATIESAPQAPAAATSVRGDSFPRRVITAEPGDTWFQLAVDHYGKRSLWKMIQVANPNLPQYDTLRGGEQVVLPEWGSSPISATASAPRPETADATVSRGSLIPARR